MALPGLAVGLRAEVARPPAPIHDLQNRLAPIRGHDLALALDHDPIRALSPGKTQAAEWRALGEREEIRPEGRRTSPGCCFGSSCA